MGFVDSGTAGRAATVTSSVRTFEGHRANGRAVPPRTPAARSEPRAGTRRYEKGQPVWRVQCGDLISRERCVTVFVDDDEVVLVGPPGETARLTADQLGDLRAALNEAAKLAER
ncbi:hypothetical protein SAMN05421810_103722 [Amycolatopsis arida]|uniref:Uncharacterized protein n=1 Tax=Amycolatopsis arida TaxID=587909 RepID=A0A1I5TYV2_9PSEU|nr:hypothetical protein [Amycolatopsis arida]TDX95903.1 hypothetical protein CLV69_10335 [Amycolatopsis arida]SFP88223.1 hypothetical protein SAMN05421810_103722 [Amycolatopsis arida]